MLSYGDLCNTFPSPCFFFPFNPTLQPFYSTIRMDAPNSPANSMERHRTLDDLLNDHSLEMNVSQLNSLRSDLPTKLLQFPINENAIHWLEVQESVLQDWLRYQVFGIIEKSEMDNAVRKFSAITTARCLMQRHIRNLEEESRLPSIRITSAAQS